MDNLGKTIQIYLPFGSPSGIKIASASSSLITGMSTNGWDYWENSEFKSLEGVKRKEI